MATELMEKERAVIRPGQKVPHPSLRITQVTFTAPPQTSDCMASKNFARTFPDLVDFLFNAQQCVGCGRNTSKLFTTTRGDKISAALPAKRHTMTLTMTRKHSNTFHRPTLYIPVTNFSQAPPSQVRNLTLITPVATAVQHASSAVWFAARDDPWMPNVTKTDALKSPTQSNTVQLGPLEFRWSYCGRSHHFLIASWSVLQTLAIMQPFEALRQSHPFTLEPNSCRNLGRHGCHSATRIQKANVTFIQGYTLNILKDI